MVLWKVRSWCINWENLVGHEQILYQADQNFQTIKPSYLIFSKSSEETFCYLEGKFREHCNLQRWMKIARSQIHNWANGMWNWNLKNSKSEINTFKFHLYMLSSNDWTVLLIAINLRYFCFILHLRCSKNLWLFFLWSAVSSVIESWKFEILPSNVPNMAATHGSHYTTFFGFLRNVQSHAWYLMIWQNWKINVMQLRQPLPWWSKMWVSVCCWLNLRKI